MLWLHFPEALKLAQLISFEVRRHNHPVGPQVEQNLNAEANHGSKEAEGVEEVPGVKTPDCPNKAGGKTKD